MITLNSIYSETELFDRVDFQPGINIILGKYSDSERSVNGIGKSTLVRLIDYALLSSTTGSLKTKKAPFLKGHTVSLELIIEGSVHKITRAFGDNKTVFFGPRDQPLIDYTFNELKTVLSDKFFANGFYSNAVYENLWFRDLMRFFVKDDINRHKQNEPINFLDYHERTAKLCTYNFYLLELPNANVYEFDKKQVETRDKKTASTQILKQIEEETGKPISELRTELARINERISRLEANLQEFAFIQTYQDVQTTLETISSSITERLNAYHAFRKTLNRYRESYEIEIEVNLAQIQNLYNELNREMGTFIQATLSEVIEFREQIAENRRRYLAEKERELNSAMTDLLKEISKLEEKRQELYSLLQEEGAFDSVRHAYEQLIEEKVSLERNNAKLSQLQEIEDSIAEHQKRLSELTAVIIQDIRASQHHIDRLRLLYKEILENAIFVDRSTEGGYLDIRESAQQLSPVQIVVDVPKSESLGKDRFRLLAYSLTVFLNIIRSGRRLPHFLIHDGVFHSIDRKTVVNVLNYVHQQSQITPNFQYIITGNEDELVIPESEKSLYGTYKFDFQQCVIATYESLPEKMIFRHEF